MTKTKITDERKQEVIDWYLAEDERTILDTAFEFSMHSSVVGTIIGEAGVGKSRHRNLNKNSPVNDGRSKPSGKSGIRTVKFKNHRGHRHRSL